MVLGKSGQVVDDAVGTDKMKRYAGGQMKIVFRE